MSETTVKPFPWDQLIAVTKMAFSVLGMTNVNVRVLPVETVAKIRELIGVVLDGLVKTPESV